jgi:nucleotide-binding universal stress UspA family protein
MGKKYLMAIDESKSSVRIANYAKGLLKSGDQITIYSVLPNPVVFYNFNDSYAPLLLENKSLFSSLENSQKQMMNKAIEKVKKILAGSGINKNKIAAKLETQVVSNARNTIAHHIVDEASKGKYDTIIIGKHNSSRLTEILLGDVTHKVIHLSKDMPVIVV